MANTLATVLTGMNSYQEQHTAMLEIRNLGCLRNNSNRHRNQDRYAHFTGSIHTQCGG